MCCSDEVGALQHPHHDRTAHHSLPYRCPAPQAAAGDGKEEAGEGKDPDAVDADVERSFWANLTLNPPLYGADTPVSFFDEKLPYGWNLNHLGDLLQTHPKVDAVPGEWRAGVWRAGAWLESTGLEAEGWGTAE